MVYTETESSEEMSVPTGTSNMSKLFGKDFFIYRTILSLALVVITSMCSSILFAEGVRQEENKSIKIQDALNKVSQYLLLNDVNPGLMIILIRLGDMYNLRDFSKFKIIYEKNVGLLDDESTQTFKIYQRMFKPDTVVPKKVLDALTENDDLTMRALYCDLYPLEANTLNFWKERLRKGEYAASHVILGYRFAIENNCDIPGYSDVFHKEMTDKLISLIDFNYGVTDLVIESMVFLALLDQQSKIKTDWIDNFFAAQLPDGGWADGRGREEDPHTEADHHATVLGLWLLLELKNGEEISPKFIKQHKQF